VTLTWLDGDQNGGSPVIDYQATYDKATGTTFEILQSNILERQFTASGLIRGSTYKFKVQSRNMFGLSDYSSELQLIIGSKPD
jgi:hypothetical protein